MVAVTGELTEKDLVVTRGNEALRGGEPLIVQNPPRRPRRRRPPRLLR